MTDIQADVRDFIIREFLRGTDPSELTGKTPLISDGVLDSLSTLQLVAFIEERYGIEVAAHEATVDYLDSLDRIADLVRSKQGDN
jgi:acyl carrier protein